MRSPCFGVSVLRRAAAAVDMAPAHVPCLWTRSCSPASRRRACAGGRRPQSWTRPAWFARMLEGAGRDPGRVAARHVG